MSVSVALWTPKHGVVTVKESDLTRCASVLKPVYAWVCNHPQWASLAKRAITVSDNQATDDLTGNNAPALAQSITDHSHVSLERADSWGRFMVDGSILANIYSAMITEHDDKGTQVLEWMRHIDGGQRFGFASPMKAGWDMYTTKHGKHHVVTNIVVLPPDGTLIAATSDHVVDGDFAERWHENLAHGGAQAVVPLHESLTRPTVREMVGMGISKIVALPR